MRSCVATTRSSWASSSCFRPPTYWSICWLTSATPSSTRASGIEMTRMPLTLRSLRRWAPPSPRWRGARCKGTAMTVAPTDLAIAAPVTRKGGLRTYVRRHPTMVVGAVLLGLMVLMAIFAPYLGTVDPQALSPIRRLRWPSAQYWFGTDMLGRDIYSRTVYGARVSLTVGISVALLA